MNKDTPTDLETWVIDLLKSIIWAADNDCDKFELKLDKQGIKTIAKLYENTDWIEIC